MAAMLMLGGCMHRSPSACPASPADVAAIESTIHAFYDSLRKEDRATFRSATTATFYAFDVGKRYAGTALIDLVRDARARGVQLNWNVGPIDTRLGCGMAWAAWENSGSAGIPPQVQPVRWLESAVLVRAEGRWKIDFFHSTRAATVTP